MKKMFLRFTAILSVVALSVSLVSCLDSSDETIILEDNNNTTLGELSKDYFTIENATYRSGSFPNSTTTETIDNIDMSSQVMNGAMNYVSVKTRHTIEEFYAGIKGVSGYYEYKPTDVNTSGGYNTYVIPIMISETYKGNSTIILSEKLDNGNVTTPVEKGINYIETQTGDIEVKLAFSNNKDIDLHLYTPSGEHIYYGNRGGTYTDEQGKQISYGLDIDSNAGCSIDGINKENIYIPNELVENGTYTVVVDMYSNCNPSIATNWSIIVRYKGTIITPITGVNPSSGVYATYASDGDMTNVMKFKITDAGSNRVNQNRIQLGSFKAIPLSEMDEIKLIEKEYNKEFYK